MMNLRAKREVKSSGRLSLDVFEEKSLGNVNFDLAQEAGSSGVCLLRAVKALATALAAASSVEGNCWNDDCH